MSKYALVTGASRGIGRAIAENLASGGYNLYLVCHTNERLLSSLSDELTAKYGVTCKCFVGDISDSSFIDEIFEGISALDVLVNNAGISYFGLMTDMSMDDWRRIMSCNLDSVFYFSKKAAVLMLHKHSGHIINISSVWGEKGAALETAYSASKGGVNSFTKALARELAPSCIRVNAIACGLINTDMNSHLDDEDMAALINEIPADRIGQPEEIGAMVMSMLSAPSYMTGQIINVDGAWT